MESSQAYLVYIVCATIASGFISFRIVTSDLVFAYIIGFAVSLLVLVLCGHLILRLIGLAVRGVTGPFSMFYLYAKEKIAERYFYDGTSRSTGFGEQKEADVGLRYFIEQDSAADGYKAKYLGD